nr:zf-CCHC domain-containing protein/UBN2 domain-containing protein [Tanacetum cinerariifolium]
MFNTQESVAANISEIGEIRFRLGDFVAEDNNKSNADLEIPSEEPIAAVTLSADKRKQHAQPSEQPELQPQAIKRGSKRKAPTSSSEECPAKQRIIFHKNRGRSERMFNQKMKKFGFAKDEEGPKALDEGFTSKNYVRKFFRALHPKWRAKVTAIKESKDLSSLALDELIGNLKVHKVVMEKDSEIYRGKEERVKSIALKAKKESSDDETSTSGSDDEEYAMTVRNFKKFFRRKGKFVRQPREEKKSFRQRDEKKGKSGRNFFRCGDPNHLIGDCPKPSCNKDIKGFIGGSWSNNENDAKDKTTMKLVSWLNRRMRDLLEKEILELSEKIKKLERSKEVEIAYKSCEELKSENAKLKETQFKFVKFDKSANSLREMLNKEKSPSCKIGLGFDSDKASTSGTKTMSFVRSSVEKGTDGSTIKVHGSTLPRSVYLRTCLDSDEWIKDSGCSKHMTGNKSLFYTYKAYDRGNVVFGSNLKQKIIGKDYLIKFDPKSYEGVFLGYSQNSKAYVVLNKHTMKVKESLNVTFDESPPPTKLSPLVDDDVGEEKVIRKNTKIVNIDNEKMS